MADNPTPRDVKLLHLILASMGVTSYQDAVPLQLMDFAYRYTLGVLNDALLYNDYANANGGQLPAGVGASSAPLTVDDIRLAVAARVQNQFKPAAPKEMLLELALERNRKPLPAVGQTYGLRLPPEKYCLTGYDKDIDESEDVVVPGFEPMNVDTGSTEQTRESTGEDQETKEEEEANDVDLEGEAMNQDD